MSKRLAVAAIAAASGLGALVGWNSGGVLGSALCAGACGYMMGRIVENFDDDFGGST